YGIYIHFAHRTFKWNNEAKGKAAVYCVIVGFANFDTKNKFIYHYENINEDPSEIKAKIINAYLVDASIKFIESRNKPICNVPLISRGNMANDGGNLIIKNEIEYNTIIRKEPGIENYIKKYIGSED